MKEQRERGSGRQRVRGREKGHLVIFKFKSFLCVSLHHKTLMSFEFSLTEVILTSPLLPGLGGHCIPLVTSQIIRVAANKYLNELFQAYHNLLSGDRWPS